MSDADGGPARGDIPLGKICQICGSQVGQNGSNVFGAQHMGIIDHDGAGAHAIGGVGRSAQGCFPSLIEIVALAQPGYLFTQVLPQMSHDPLRGLIRVENLGYRGVGWGEIAGHTTVVVVGTGEDQFFAGYGIDAEVDARRIQQVGQETGDHAIASVVTDGHPEGEGDFDAGEFGRVGDDLNCANRRKGRHCEGHGLGWWAEVEQTVYQRRYQFGVNRPADDQGRPVRHNVALAKGLEIGQRDPPHRFRGAAYGFAKRVAFVAGAKKSFEVFRIGRAPFPIGQLFQYDGSLAGE